MTCLSNKVFFISGPWSVVPAAHRGYGVTGLRAPARPENNACEVTQLCVCAIFTLFQYHAYVKVWLCLWGVGKKGQGQGVAFG